MCQRKGWAPKGVDTMQCASKNPEPWMGRLGVGGPTSIGEGMSAHEDAGP